MVQKPKFGVTWKKIIGDSPVSDVEYKIFLTSWCCDLFPLHYTLLVGIQSPLIGSVCILSPY